MYKAFQIKDITFSEELIEYGKSLFEKSANVVGKNLKGLLSGGKINGSQLRDDWFPSIKTDVFISHSSKDANLAYGLAGWLDSEFSIRSFIDSAVWGHSSDLLRQLDNDFCYDENRGSYDYQSRNSTTSHVHMMLATSLTRMLDQAECAIFLPTPISISHSNGQSPKLNSPWIYYELAQMDVIRKRTPERIVLLKEARDKNFSSKGADIPIEYDMPFKDLPLLKFETLRSFETNWNGPTKNFPCALDLLYALT